jgi:protein-tyrosine phosphatase
MDRSLPFEAVFNFRDLGGLGWGRHGGVVRGGLLFRADGLDRLTAGDVELLRPLGIRTVLDLRTDGEVARRRFPVDRYPVAFHHVPVMREPWDRNDPLIAEQAHVFLTNRYLVMIEQGRAELARAVELLAAADALPAVFHCAAGKDRTGLVTMLVLGLLGVPDAAIAADYALSEQAVMRIVEYLRVTGQQAVSTMEAMPPVFRAAPASVALAVLERLRDLHGSIEGFVLDAGVSPDAIKALRRQLLH